MRVETAPTREGLAAMALIRRQELDGFVEGLFGREEAIDLPERAHRSLDLLGEMRAMFAAVNEVATDLSKPANDKSSARSKSAPSVSVSGAIPRLELKLQLRHVRF
jgi:hypothetical protein